jgi:hypothetical protein
VRDHISDDYRKTMRKIDPAWKKGKHHAPTGWNESDLMINNIVPEAALKPGYTVPPSMPFKDLAIGLKKLPRGDDSGDITRALDYAMRNRKVNESGKGIEFLFPDDLQAILDHIGRTPVSQAHTDRSIIARYSSVLRQTDSDRRKQTSGERRQKKLAEQMVTHPPDMCHSHQLPSPQQLTLQSVMPHIPYLSSYEDIPLHSHAMLEIPPTMNLPLSTGRFGGMPLTGMGAVIPTPMQMPHMSQDVFQDTGYGSTVMTDFKYTVSSPPPPPRSTSHDAVAAVASKLVLQGAEQAVVDFPDIPDCCRFEEDDKEQFADLTAWEQLDPMTVAAEMDALVAANQTYDFIGLLTPSPEDSGSRPIDL